MVGFMCLKDVVELVGFLVLPGSLDGTIPKTWNCPVFLFS